MRTVNEKLALCHNVNEKLILNKQSELSKIEHKYFPKSREELSHIISQLIDTAKKNNQPIDQINFNLINTSEITSMENLFKRFQYKIRESADKVKLNIDLWDVSNVTDMSHMFMGCTKFTADLSLWNVRKLQKADFMFFKCWNFNGEIFQNINDLISADNMFTECKLFNQKINNWNVSNLETAECMFKKCLNFNQDLSSWKPRSLTNINFMFMDCQEFNQDLSSWKLGKNVTKVCTFTKCPKLKTIPKWYKK